MRSMMRAAAGAVAVMGAFAVMGAAPEQATKETLAKSWNLLHTGAADSKPEVRQAAAAALGSMKGVAEAEGMLKKMLAEDVDPDVRETAATGLGTMKAAGAIPALKDAIDDPDAGVSFAAVRALWEMGDYSGRPVLEDVLAKRRGVSSGGMQKEIRTAKKQMRSPAELAKIGFDNASGALLGPFSIGVGPAKSLLKDSGAPNRAMAADMLARHCNDESREALEERLAAEGNWGVKTAIARALAQCGDEKSMPILEAYLVDSREPLQFMAAASIIRLSQPVARAAAKPRSKVRRKAH